MVRTIIIVPCFNEAARLDIEAFKRFASSNQDIAFVFVDDGSTDDTWLALEHLNGADSEAFRVLSLPKNRGKAEAVRQGVLTALRLSPEYVGFWDADLATPLDTIPTFVEILDNKNKIELVTGARVKLLGRKIERYRFRHYLGRVFATLVGWILSLEIYDTQCGAKLFRVTRSLSNIFDRPFSTTWIFDTEIIARMIAIRRSSKSGGVDDVIYEHPLRQWTDVAGSKVGFRAYLRSAVDLIRLHQHYFATGKQTALTHANAPVIDEAGAA